MTNQADQKYREEKAEAQKWADEGSFTHGDMIAAFDAGRSGGGIAGSLGFDPRMVELVKTMRDTGSAGS